MVKLPDVHSVPGGVTWVLLRGLGREAGHWADVPQKLARATGSGRVLTPDLPGAGVLYEQSSPLLVPAIARAVRAALFAQTQPHSLYLVGLSLGSMVALSWAQQWPSEVRGLALISASVGSLCPPWWRCRPAALAAFGRVAWSRNGAEREANVLRLSSGNAKAQANALAPWTALAASRPVSRVNLARQLLAAARFRPHLAPLPIPTVVLAGQRDRIVDLRCALKLAHALAAPVMVHPTAGHDVPLDEPDWLVQQLVALSANVTKAI